MRSDTTFEYQPSPVTSIGPRLERARDPNQAFFEEEGFGKRYEARELLGKGGMGEVHLQRDARIGRDVAMKMIRTDKEAQSDLQTRFFREARVQGQLEHPSIVPVYDVGVGPDGALYFTMKRVHGVTLAGVLDRLSAREPEAEREFSLRKLLSAFASVCLAIEFAHTRGVVHRDLKPSNVMLGNFGEVYVLDWGIARILEDADEAMGPRSAAHPTPSDAAPTDVGAFVGTPGYVSPEQIANEVVDARADVYSLGAVLFRMLTLLPLHTGRAAALLASTTRGADARCSRRAPERDVPPELEEICIRATMTDARDRFASARDLHDAVQKYLDGDRDTERRRELARERANVAMAALAEAKNNHASSAANRAIALAELGRSVALDPSNDTALTGIVSLLLERPREIPEEVKKKLEASREASMRAISVAGIGVFGGGLLLVGGSILWMGVKDWLWTSIMLVFFAMALGGCIYRTQRASPYSTYFVMTVCTLGIMTMTRIFGAFVLVPTCSMGAMMIYSMYPGRGVQRIAGLAMSAATLLPIFLEWVQVLPRSYVFRGGEIAIVSQACAFPEAATTVFLVTLTSLLFFSAGRLVRRIGNKLAAAEEDLAVRAWQFRQLVPAEARHRIE
jgi:serine/threonine protein kinase